LGKPHSNGDNHFDSYRASLNRKKDEKWSQIKQTQWMNIRVMLVLFLNSAQNHRNVETQGSSLEVGMSKAGIPFIVIIGPQMVYWSSAFIHMTLPTPHFVFISS
jgi:hypothetical protein